MAFEGHGRRAAVPDVITDEAEGGKGIEVGGNGNAGSIGIPETESFIRQLMPGEERARIILSPGGDIAMTDKVGSGDIVILLKAVKQVQQTGDLGVGEGFKAIVVQLDADRDRIYVGDIAPAADAGLPGPQVIVQHMVDRTITADHIVS